MEDRYYSVYIMSNPSRTALYTGITNNLMRRVWEHREKVADGFTRKYNIIDLIYFEIFDTPFDAIEREKQIKSWSRKRKDQLIKTTNPTLKDLSEEIASW